MKRESVEFFHKKYLKLKKLSDYNAISGKEERKKSKLKKQISSSSCVVSKLVVREKKIIFFISHSLSHFLYKHKTFPLSTSLEKTTIIKFKVNQIWCKRNSPTYPLNLTTVWMTECFVWPFMVEASR